MPSFLISSILSQSATSHHFVFSFFVTELYSASVLQPAAYMFQDSFHGSCPPLKILTEEGRKAWNKIMKMRESNPEETT